MSFAAASTKVAGGSALGRVGLRKVALSGLKPRAVGARRVGASKRSVSVLARWGTSGSSSGGSAAVVSKAAAVKSTDAKNFAMNKGYTLLDIRSAGEHNSGAKRWFANLPFDSESSFKSAFQKEYPMKSARIIIADDTGSKASTVAAAIAGLGYTNVACLEGGLSAYFKVDPLNSKDKVGKGGLAPPASRASLEATWRAPAVAAPAASSADRFASVSAPKKASPSPAASSFRSADSAKFPAVSPLEAKKCAMDKGYTLLDIRSAQEHNAASKRWFVNLPFDTESAFRREFEKQFPMKSARIVLACDDGTDRTSGAAAVLASLGYSNVVSIEGGVNAYLRFDPLGPKDRSSTAGAAAAAARAPAASASAGSRFGLASPAAAPRSSSGSSSYSPSASSSASKAGTVKPIEAKALALNKGYSFVDVRSAAEHAKGSKRWMMNMPVDDPQFKAKFSAQFFNKLARVIVACEDGVTKSATAAAIIGGLGYSNVKVLEGGMSAYLRFDPVTGKAAKPVLGGAAAAVSRPAAAAPAAPSSSSRFASVSSSSGSSSKVPAVNAIDAKKFALDRGYVLVDVRSASEHSRGSKKWFLNVPADSVSRFAAEIEKQYPFKNARLIVADATGGSTAAGAADALVKLGYSNIVTLEGGVAAYLKYDPLMPKDKKPLRA